MSLEENSIVLTELFEQVITNPKIDVCTDELKGSSILDANILRLLKRGGELSIKELGASGIFVSGNNLQAIFGTTSDQLKSQIEEIIREEEKK